MRRTLVASLVALLALSGSALAAEQNTAATIAPAATAAASSVAADAAATINLAPHLQNTRRPLALPSLYVSSAILQGYDAYSTLTVIEHGGVEANPLMQSITKSPVAFIGLKAAVTAMSIMSAERMWKDHNRVGAVLTMVASNGLMAIVAAHNAAVLNKVRGVR